MSIWALIRWIWGEDNELVEWWIHVGIAIELQKNPKVQKPFGVHFYWILIKSSMISEFYVAHIIFKPERDKTRASRVRREKATELTSRTGKFMAFLLITCLVKNVWFKSPSWSDFIIFSNISVVHKQYCCDLSLFWRIACCGFHRRLLTWFYYSKSY